MIDCSEFCKEIEISEMYTIEPELIFKYNEDMIKQINIDNQNNINNNKDNIFDKSIGLKNFSTIQNINKKILEFNLKNFTHYGNVLKMIALKNSGNLDEIKEIAYSVQNEAKY